MTALRHFITVLLCSAALLSAEKAQEIDLPAEAARSFRDGLFLLKREKFQDAAQRFKAAIEKNPKLAEAYNNYAYCIRKVSPENYQEALKYYGAAIKLKPSLAVAYQYRGCLHTLMGNYDLASRDLKTLRSLDLELAKSLELFLINKGEKEGGFAGSY